MDYTISPKLKSETLKPEYGIVRPDPAKASAESRKLRTISGLVGLVVTSVVGFGSYYGFKVLKTRENMARIGAVVISLAPCSCSCATLLYFTGRALADEKRALKDRQIWDSAGAILSDSTQTFTETWKKQIKEVTDFGFHQQPYSAEIRHIDIYNQLRDDVQKMVGHLDGWKSELNKNTLTKAQKDAAIPILQKMASQVTVYFSVSQSIREYAQYAENASGVGNINARVGVYSHKSNSLLPHQQTFLALETLLRTGEVETTRTVMEEFVKLDSPAAAQNYSLPLAS